MHAPELLRIGAEKCLVQRPTEAGRHPILEARLRARAKMRTQAGTSPSPESPHVFAQAEAPEEVRRLERVAKTAACVQNDAASLAQKKVIAQQLLEPARQGGVARNEPMAAEIETPSVECVRG